MSVDIYIEKIKPVIRRIKFSQLKMDDIAKYMDISKVTLYKHFSSKDEIIEQVVEYYINYYQAADTVVKDNSVSFIESFQKTFEQSLICVVFISDLFLHDLKEFYPHLFENLAAAQQIRNKNLQTFFESGMDQKIFNKMKQYQLLKPEYLDTVDDSVIEKEIVKILQTIS